MVVLTLGYEGIGIQEYVDTLRAHSVGIVIDVRETAWSFKKGFSKAPLAKALASARIDYLHLKSAGKCGPTPSRRQPQVQR